MFFLMGLVQIFGISHSQNIGSLKLNRIPIFKPIWFFIHLLFRPRSNYTIQILTFIFLMWLGANQNRRQIKSVQTSQKEPLTFPRLSIKYAWKPWVFSI